MDIPDDFSSGPRPRSRSSSRSRSRNTKTCPKDFQTDFQKAKQTLVFSHGTFSLRINHYLKNDFNGYPQRFFIGTPAAEQQEQEKHKDMPRQQHARTHERTETISRLGFASELHPQPPMNHSCQTVLNR